MLHSDNAQVLKILDVIFKNNKLLRAYFFDQLKKSVNLKQLQEESDLVLGRHI